MAIPENLDKPFYAPAEVAEMLGVSVDQLRQMRWQGRIKGTSVGNSTMYTPMQIRAADTSPWPRGRGSRRKKTPNGGDNSSSVMLMRNRLTAHPLMSLAS